MASARSTLLYSLQLTVIVLLSVASVQARRSRARINDSRFMYKKDGTCPASEVVNRLSNAVCDNEECVYDADCEGTEKCCINSCGGRSCVVPQDIVTDPPVISEVDDQSGLLTVNEGETAVLYCNASSRIPTSFGWILIQPGASVPNIDVFPPGSATGNKQVSSDGRIMTVTGATIQDTANYACVAASLLGYVTRSYQLFVHATGSGGIVHPPGTIRGEDQPLAAAGAANSNPDVASNWPELVNPYLTELSQRISTTPPPTAVPTPTMASVPPGGGGLDGAFHGVTNSVCQQPRNKGTCNSQEQRWFFNTSKGKCELFTYSGCNGNLNNFQTYDDCNRTCPPLSDNPCEQPITTGPCRARIMRWGYDSNAGGCVKFVYGGCRKNGNNFGTREDCADRCMQSMMIYETLQQTSSARVAECRCTRPRLKNCFCASEFAIEGTVIQKHNSLRGDILVVEVANVFKQGTLSLRKTERLTNNVTIIRDMSQIGRSCQCHSLEPNSVPYIIMGYVNTRGDAEIDSNSYVSEATRRRSNKLGSQNMRPQYCRQASRQSPRERSGSRGRQEQ
ncbi:papilin-like [Lytechinus variegatus]|uniref:papilin-like n=1 Tax=Lytechinus variegatus TaxID=7654 RepID=UPI001BB27692|nr:papilin-like [Lytechinus variegatus]